MSDDLKAFKEFLKMCADAGIEMTLTEGRVNYSACVAGVKIISDGHTIDEAIDIVQSFAHEEFRPDVFKKFFTEAQDIGLL